jgi:hypothetical protein
MPVVPKISDGALRNIMVYNSSTYEVGLRCSYRINSNNH